MSIEEEIKQVSFKDERQKALINILYTSHFLEERIRTFLSPEGLTHQQFNVLRILRGSYPKPLSTMQIRARMIDKMSDTSRIVERLVKKELAQKKICPDDKRLVDVKITRKGIEKLRNLDAMEEDLMSMLSHLSENKLMSINTLMDELRHKPEG